MTNAASAKKQETPEFVFTRNFNAPRVLVWRAWTEAERLAQWWGPKGAEWLGGTLDLRPGGAFHYGMKFNGMEMWGKFVYREIEAPGRLVYVSSFSDADGNLVRAPFFADWPMEVLNVVTFTEDGGITHAELRGGPINATEAEIQRFASQLPGMKQGFGGTFDQLDAYLAKG